MGLMAQSNEIWAEAARTLASERPFALATVIGVRGSTPREVGAKMIVRSDGQFGTIGGGCGEAEVFRKARLLLDEGVGARLAEVDLTGDLDQQEIGTCGGIMEVFINLWSPRDDRALAQRLADAVAQRRPAAILSLIEAGGKTDLPPGAKVLIDPLDGRVPPELGGLSPTAFEQLRTRARDGVAGLLEIDAAGGLNRAVRADGASATRVFVDPVSGVQRLIIVGAGHIAQPLAALGTMLGFSVTVIDDRASFANRERFPSADEIIVKPFAAAIDSLSLDHNCYLLSVTRGHAFDDATVRAALRQPGCFIGMIGSRRRVKATLERMEKDGIDPLRLDEIHAPLGLDIGADTPEEIAVSIMAEIIRERRRGRRDELTLGVKNGRLRPTR
ncbi:MAG TPA: XdhC family protein [Candidatus Binataceae bacterium]|nr:XdhC family protein [Candidatus Binataceae bacterium]